LNHPNIVTVFDVIRTGQGAALVMELVDGVSLRELMRGPVPARQIVQIALQTAQALAAAHAGGILHRDVKPENIMVRADGLVKLLDFGLARRLAQDQGGGAVAGTPRYMSPEQLSGDVLGPATDIYSLGLVLYELIAQAHPFPAASALDTLQAIFTQDPLPLSPVDPTVPERLSALVMSMLSRIPGQRPSAEAIVRQMEQFADEREQKNLLRRTLLAGAALCAPIAAIWLTTKRWSVRRSPPITPVALTGEPGAQTQARFSPDGRQIAYTVDSPAGDRRIFVRAAALGSKPRLLTPTKSTPDDKEYSPAWSPDGAQIAFLRFNEDRA